MKKIIWILVIFLLVLGLGIFLGWMLNKAPVQQKVSSQTILNALRERGFLVTQTEILNQSIKIDSGEQSFWQKFLWGQVVKAQAVVEVNLGVDLAKMSESDIKISADKIEIDMPPAEIFNSRVVGDLNLENSEGILKRLLESDDGYNKAMAELTKQAEAAAGTPDKLKAAGNKAADEIKQVVGYLSAGKTVEVIKK